MAEAWYCRISGQQFGPLSSRDLKAMVVSGQLVPENLVRQGTDGQWVTASRVKGLFNTAATPAGAATRKPASAASPPATSQPTRSAPAPSGLPPLDGGGLPDLDPLDDLAPLDNLPTGQLPVGHLPTGYAVPMGQTLSGAAASAMQGNSEWTENSAAGSPQRAFWRSETAEPEEESYSIARVVGVAITAMAFAFLGVCTILFPIVPVVFGVVAVLLGVRALTLTSHKSTLNFGLALVAVFVGLVAGGGGLYRTMKEPDPLGKFREMVGISRKGRVPKNDSGPAPPQDHDDVTQQSATSDATVAPVDVGDVQILITDAAIRQLPSVSQPFFFVSVRLENHSSHKVNYTSWSGTIPDSDSPNLQDDKGKRYPLIARPDLVFKNQLHKETLNPESFLVDMLVFETPPEKFDNLELQLPLSGLSEKPKDGLDKIRFRIPRQFVRHIGQDRAEGK